MKSFVCLVFVLALIGLAQPALTNVYRFRHVESVEQKVADPADRADPILKQIEELKTTSKARCYKIPRFVESRLYKHCKIVKDMMFFILKRQKETIRLYK